MESPTTPPQAWPLEAVASQRLRRRELGHFKGSPIWIEHSPGDPSVPIRTVVDGTVSTLTPPGFRTGAKLHTYGAGSAVEAGDGTLWCIDQETGTLVTFSTSLERTEIDLLALGGLGDLAAGPDGSLFCVRALEEQPHREQVCQFTSGNHVSHRVIFESPGFVSCPSLSPSGRWLAVTTWPERGTAIEDATVVVVDLFAEDAATRRIGVLGVSTSQPTWIDDEHLVVISTVDGRSQLVRADLEGNVSSCPPLDGECRDEHYWSGRTSVVNSANNEVTVAIRRAGLDALARVDLVANSATMINGPWVRIDGLASDGETTWVLGSTARGRSLLWSVDGGGEVALLCGQEHDGVVATAACFYAPGAAGTVPGHFFAPTQQRGNGLVAPLICIAHGGPIESADPSFDPVVQALCARGFAVALVDYRGSTGYGDQWRHGLDGHWGIADVEDCASAARYLANLGLVDPKAMFIRGTSAGGYTALLSLRQGSPFLAACAISAVTDLDSLAAVTPPIERGILDRVVGDQSPSPLALADQLTGAILLLSGSEDLVVPLSQAVQLVSALRARDADVELVILEGEGHSIRTAANIVTALDAELRFYERVMSTVSSGTDL